MNYREVLNMGIARLESAGIEGAKVDAKLLLQKAADLSSTELVIKAYDEVEKEKEEAYFAFLKKREKRIPLQYITGEAPFMNYVFKTNEKVLIPRFDTEILVDNALKNAPDQKISVLDMCCGTGCIGISFFLERKRKGISDSVTLVDISDDAIAVSKENSKLLGADVNIVKSDLYNEIKNESFDMLLSNPPYIKSSEIETLLPEVKDYEPHLALDGKENGLYFYKRIIEGLKERLNDNGKVIFEIGCDQYEAVKGLLVDNSFRNIRVVKDLSGLDRVVIAEK